MNLFTRFRSFKLLDHGYHWENALSYIKERTKITRYKFNSLRLPCKCCSERIKTSWEQKSFQTNHWQSGETHMLYNPLLGLLHPSRKCSLVKKQRFYILGCSHSANFSEIKKQEKCHCFHITRKNKKISLITLFGIIYLPLIHRG